MKLTISLLWMLVLVSCPAGQDTTHLEKDLLHLEAKILLPGVGGRIDHMAYDSAGQRVFVAALGNNTVEVVDLKKRARVNTITGQHEPQGVAYIAPQARLLVANGSSGDCVFYDGQNFKELGRTALGDDADNVRYDGSKAYVGYGSGGIAIIDPVTMQKVAGIALKKHPESFQLGDKIWINIPDEGEIAQADKQHVTGHWKNHDASANFPMALDTLHHRLFVGYRHPARLQILDSRTGDIQASIPCVSDADDVFYDTDTRLVFISGGDGYIDVIRDTTLVNHIPTRRGARTSLWLPSERKLILAVPARGGQDAALWVYRVEPTAYTGTPR